MSTFNEADHPRNHPTGASRFSDKPHSEPESNLSTNVSSARGAAIRADWGGVTLAEYAALDVARDPNAVARINSFWDDVREANPLALPEDPPSRLTPHGAEWLEQCHADYASAWPLDEPRQIAIARDILKGLGTLVVMNLQRRARDPQGPKL